MEVQTMNVNGVTSSVPNLVGKSDHASDPVLREQVRADKAIREKIVLGNGEKPESEKGGPLDIERLVLKPSTISPEERLKQVISVDEVKRLMQLYSPYRMRMESLPNDRDPGRLFDIKG